MTDISYSQNDLFINGRKLPHANAECSIIRLPLIKGSFCFADYERSVLPVMWRINIQVIAMQMGGYKIAISNEERILWKSRILESLLRLNEKAQKINAVWPLDLPAPTAEYAALSATGNWCDTLTRDLTCLFSSAPDADIMRIENG